MWEITAPPAPQHTQTTEDRIGNNAAKNDPQRRLGPKPLQWPQETGKKETMHHFEAIETAKGNNWRLLNVRHIISLQGKNNEVETKDKNNRQGNSIKRKKM